MSARLAAAPGPGPESALTGAMAERIGADLTAAVLDGRLDRDGYETLIAVCRRCRIAPECLVALSRAAEAAPEACANVPALEALR